MISLLFLVACAARMAPEVALPQPETLAAAAAPLPRPPAHETQLSGREVLSRRVDRPIVVAHRGGAAHAPENTLVAYRQAMAAGARVAELDIHMSADGVPVVIHDATTLRTTGVDALVGAMKWSDLAGLDAGAWFGPQFAGERLPTLGEVLDLTHGKLTVCIEIKAGVGVVEAVTREVDARGMRNHVVVFSFDAEALLGIKAAMPEVATLLLSSHAGTPPGYGPETVTRAVELGVSAIGYSHRLVTPELVRAAHEAGLPVFVWTVNQPEAAEAMRALGVDGLITDAPAEAEGWLAGGSGPR